LVNAKAKKLGRNVGLLTVDLRSTVEGACDKFTYSAKIGPFSAWRPGQAFQNRKEVLYLSGPTLLGRVTSGRTARTRRPAVVY
jgi:hypothetical protein